MKNLKYTLKNYKQQTIIQLDDIQIGKDFTIIAGPCAVESEEQILQIANSLKNDGVKIMRGGAYKPRTSPYSFQGLEEKGLQLLYKAKQQTGLKIVTEIMDDESIALANDYVDIFQVGARNMQNFSLLKKLGKQNKPILLKRGMACKISEWLMSAEYIMNEGNQNIILCERGIRTFETMTRNTLDINAVPVLKDLTHLPIFVDPSHAVGHAKYVPALSKASLFAGADGLMIEAHNDPKNAMSDGEQSLDLKEFRKLNLEINELLKMI